MPLLSHRLLDHPTPAALTASPRPAPPRGVGLAFVLVVAASSASGSLAAFTAQPGAVNSQLAMVTLLLVTCPRPVLPFLTIATTFPPACGTAPQLFAALSMLLLSPLAMVLPAAFVPGVLLGLLLRLPPLILLLIAVTAVVNFINFMDRLDGLVAICIAVAIAALAIQLSALWPICALVGSL